MEKKGFKKIDGIILGIILFTALILRLYKINAPLSDFHSWRQADTAAVARNFIKDGFDLFKPRYDDLSSIQSGVENPNGFRFVEFPLYNALFAAIYKILPILPIEIYGRLTTAFFSLIIIAILYYLLLKEHERLSACIGAAIYGIFPAFVFFSRVVLPETMGIAFSFMSILFLYWWEEGRKKRLSILFFSLSIICFSVSVLIKPPLIFFSITLVYLFFARYKLSVLKRYDIYLFFILALFPLFLWRTYIQQYPEGIPASGWLITSVNTFEGQKNIFFKPAFFRWVFYERINLMIFGGFLTVFFVQGIVLKFNKYLLHSILFASFAYLFVFQGGNVQHEYYQTVLLPVLAIFAGIGISLFVAERQDSFHPVVTYPFVFFLLILAFTCSYYYRVKDFYTYPQDLNQMARILDTFTKPDDKVITDRLGDTTLLYLSNRRGAPMLYKTLEQLKADGYSYYMTDKKEIITDLKEKKQYPILFENSQFVLFKI